MRQDLILDVGTSSVRAALIDETLRILRLETARRTAPALFDAEAEWTLLHALMKTAASGAGDLAGVAVLRPARLGGDGRARKRRHPLLHLHACMPGGVRGLPLGRGGGLPGLPPRPRP